LNQRAWIGHAGCFLATGSPEETTRLGWHELDDGEQYGANAAADAVIAEWVAATAHSHGSTHYSGRPPDATDTVGRATSCRLRLVGIVDDEDYDQVSQFRWRTRTNRGDARQVYVGVRCSRIWLNPVSLG